MARKRLARCSNENLEYVLKALPDLIMASFTCSMVASENMVYFIFLGIPLEGNTLTCC
jgi:hypothetical protein